MTTFIRLQEVANTTHTVIDASTGRVILSGATDVQFDRWYDHHAFWRKPRNIEEVHPALRASYESADGSTHFLIED